MVKGFHKELVKDVRRALQEAVKGVEGGYGVKITIGNASFTASNIRFKVEVAKVVNGKVETREAEDFKAMAEFYGFEPEDLGRKFVNRDGEECIIVGLLRRSHKYPILYQRLWDKHMFKASPQSVKFGGQKNG